VARGGATGMAEVCCRHDFHFCMLWVVADEDSVVKEGRSADNIKRSLHNSDVLIFCNNSYVHGTEAAFGRSSQYIQNNRIN